MLVKYIRDFKGKPVGMVVALDRDMIGYSYCNVLDRKNWSRKIAKKIAITRAVEGYVHWIQHYQEVVARREKTGSDIMQTTCYLTWIMAEMEEMKDRAERYFKKGAIDKLAETFSGYVVCKKLAFESKDLEDTSFYEDNFEINK
jgi:hypothetical protein